MHNQTRTLKRFAASGLAAIACFAAVNASAITVKVKVENVSETDGLWFTPVFFGFHDGSFDTFDAGSPASTSIENLAEGGDPSGLVGDISGVYGSKSNVLLQDPTAGGPPGVLFAPGESNYFMIDLDSMYNRYLSFASMLLPTNDSFFGNDDAMAYELFDMYGNFNHGLEINLFGTDIWDAGTEQNDLLGAPLSALGGMSTDTMGNVMHLGQSGLDGLSGAGLVTGTYLSSNLYAGDQIARISVQQVPDSTSYIGFLGAAALVGFRLITRKRMGKEEA